MVKKICAAVLAIGITVLAFGSSANAEGKERKKVSIVTDLSSEGSTYNFAADLQKKSDADYYIKYVKNSSEALDAAKNDEEFKTRISDSDYIIIAIGMGDFVEPVVGSIKSIGNYSNIHDALANLKESDAKKIKADFTATADNIEDFVGDVEILNSGSKTYLYNIYNPLSMDQEILSTEEYLNVSVANQYIENADHLGFINGVIKSSAEKYANVNLVDAKSDFEGKGNYYTDIVNMDPSLNEAGNNEIRNLFLDTFLGDIDGNGARDSRDATRILVSYANFIANGEQSLDKFYSDVNLDGAIDSKDATVILKYYANYINNASTVKKIVDYIN